MAKQILIKSFDSDNNYIKNITDATFESLTKVINGGIGNLNLKVARKIDEFDDDNDLSLNNKIEVWIYDEDSGNDGVKIFTGWIEQQNPYIDGGEEYVDILCVSLISKLRNDILKSSSQTTLYTIATTGLTTASASIAAAEIADVAKAIIDLFKTNNSNIDIDYNPAGTILIEDTDNNIKYNFEAMTYLDAIEKCRETAPQNTYWRIDADGYIYLSTPSNEADHNFILEKHVKKIKANKSLDSIKNIILIWDGQGAGNYKEYKDDTSISLYGRRVKHLIDSNIEDVTTMNNIGNSFINENKDPKVRITLEIIDNNESDVGYDIESIEVGDTCKIVGISEDSDIFGENMIIREVIWELDKATLVIETESDFNIDRYILNIEKDLNQEKKYQIIETYS